MKNRLAKKILFVAVSLLFLSLGIIGVSRQSLRSGEPFGWEDREYRVVVTEVTPGSVAQKAGMTKGDILQKMDGRLLKTGQEIEFLLDSRKSGQKVSFTIQRGEEELSISLTLIPKYGKRFIVLNMLLGMLFWIVGIFVYLNKPEEKAG